jgi:hypothetical protein
MRSTYRMLLQSWRSAHCLTLVYGGTLFVVLIWAARLRFSLPLTPFADEDFYGYLNPAISALTGGGFKHLIGREFLYPLFVFLTLRLCSDFRCISITQHVLGLATGVVLVMAWEELIRSYPRRTSGQKSGLTKLTGNLLLRLPGLCMAAVYLSWSKTILAEHTIRPEAVFPFFAASSLWLNLRFIRLCWRQGCPASTWRVGGLHLFVSCVLLMLRPSFGLAAVLINIPLATALWQHRCHAARCLKPIVIALGAVVLLLFIPEYLLRKHDRLVKRLLPAIRLYTHADLVLRQLESDLATGKTRPYDRRMLQTIHDRLASAYADAQAPQNHPWHKLGFNPDYIYLKRDVFDPYYPRVDRSKDRDLERFCNYYFIRTALHQPTAMAAKICRQLSFFYSFNNRFPPFQTWFHASHGPANTVADLYQLELRKFAYPKFAKAMESFDLGRRQLEQCRHLANDAGNMRESVLANAVRECLWDSYNWVLLAALASCGALLSVPRLRRVYGVNVASTLLLYSYNFGNCLTIAIVFYLGDPRYIITQETFTLFAEFAGVVLTMHAVFAFFRHRLLEADSRGERDPKKLTVDRTLIIPQASPTSRLCPPVTEG